MRHPADLDRRFLFRVILPMLGLIAFLLAGAIVGLVMLAGKQNYMSMALQQQTAQNALSHFRDALADVATGFAGRDETARHVIARVDPDWIDTHLPPSPSEAFLFILDPRDRTLFSRSSGLRVGIEARGTMPPGFLQMISRWRAGSLGDPVTEVLAIDGRPYVMAMSGVHAVGYGNRPADNGYLLAIAHRFDHDSLGELASTFMLRNLRYEPVQGADSGERGRIRLMSGDGTMADALVWDPFLPGDDLLRAVGPGLALAFAAYICLTVVVFRFVRRAARLIGVSEEKALHDALTGLPNRLLLIDRLQALLDPAGDHEAAVLFLDLDGFKEVNDAEGHAAGDAVLVGVARRLGELCRDEDTVARLGGDEFVMVIPAADRRVVAARADTILASLSSPYHHNGRLLTIGVSIGIATATDGDSDAIGLLRRADDALYAAKANGKGTIRFHADGVSGHGGRGAGDASSWQPEIAAL